MQWLTAGLGALTLLLFLSIVARSDHPTNLQGRLLPLQMRRQVPWKTLFSDDLEKGTTLPAHTNVLIHLPADGTPITRKILLGADGERWRYWGYCFPPEGNTPRLHAGAFPGTVFLSERERLIRFQTQLGERRERPLPPSLLTEEILNETLNVHGRIRHQQEVFEPGSTCYVMSEGPLAIGIDQDEDGLNGALEKNAKTDPHSIDTDHDGLDDGLEVPRLRSDTLLTASDGDGLPDSTEDKNKNGRTDIGETDALQRDTDHDGLCDGLCSTVLTERVGFSAPQGYAFPAHEEMKGEDKNLNGTVDEKETDPRKWDTDGDDISDEQEFYACKLAGEEDC